MNWSLLVRDLTIGALIGAVLGLLVGLLLDWVGAVENPFYVMAAGIMAGAVYTVIGATINADRGPGAKKN